MNLPEGLPSKEFYAIQFHHLYEELAPSYGYKTREDTREFDPNSQNGKLMIDVCNRVVAPLVERVEELEKFEKIGAELTQLLVRKRDEALEDRDLWKIENESRADWISKICKIIGYDNSDGFHCTPDAFEIASKLVAERDRLKEENKSLKLQLNQSPL